MKILKYMQIIILCFITLQLADSNLKADAFVGVVRGAAVANKAVKAAKNSKKIKETVKAIKSKRLSDSLLLGKEAKAMNIKNIKDLTKSFHKSKIGQQCKQFLGNNSIKVDKGKWRNLKGTKQFRVKPNDYLGKHPAPNDPNYIGPHAHF